MGDHVKVRIPFVEILGMQYGDAFSSGGRVLSTPERDMLMPIFGSSVSYEKVRVVISAVIAAPTTLGNYIRIPPGYSITLTNSANTNKVSSAFYTDLSGQLQMFAPASHTQRAGCRKQHFCRKETIPGAQASA